jgi:D-sedoheptulose 7-phosphate isomerase
MNAGSLADASARFCALLGNIECRQGDRPLAIDAGISVMLDMLATLRQAGGSVFVLGNGGSAAVAAHIQNDLVNKGRVRAQVLHEPSLLTCMSNDFSYDDAFARLVDMYARHGDMLVTISSSGQSSNMLNAVAAARQTGATVVTLSGFAPGNPLRMLGDLNFWSPSGDYGEVEVSHLFLLHYIADSLAERS